MTIAVNTRQLRSDEADGLSELLLNGFSVLAKRYPLHRFIYIFDQPFDQKFITSENIIPVITTPEAKSGLRLRYWFNYRVPAVLKKYHADVFISLDGICSLRTRVPQCLLMNDLSFIFYPQFYPKSIVRFYKRFTPKFLAKANVIATLSESSKKDITQRFAIVPGKISLVYRSAAPDLSAINGKERESIKEDYINGKEYFLYKGPLHPGKNLTNLLKAFSYFKKRQKSSMQLVIVGKKAGDYHQFAKDLKTFKFRSEVKWLNDLSESIQAKILAAAYAMVYPVYIDNDNTVIEAMQCGVPVIVSTATCLPQSFASAVLYADPENFMDIADKMMLLFKDEDKWNLLGRAGMALAQKNNPAKTADMLWDCINASIKMETA